MEKQGLGMVEYQHNKQGVGGEWSRYEANIPVKAYEQQSVFTTITLPKGVTLEQFKARDAENKSFSIVIPGKSEPHEVYQRRIQELAESTGQAVMGFDLYAQGKSTSEPVIDPRFSGNKALISHIDGNFLDKNGAAFATAANSAAKVLGASHISHVFAHSTGFMAFEGGVTTLRSGITIGEVNLLAPYVGAKIGGIASVANKVMGFIAGKDGLDNVHIADRKAVLHKDFGPADIEKRQKDLGIGNEHIDFRKEYYRQNPGAEKIYATRGWIDGSLEASEKIMSPQRMEFFAKEMKARGVARVNFLYDEADVKVSADATKAYMDSLADDYGLQVFRQDTNRPHAFHHSREADGLFAMMVKGNQQDITDFLDKMKAPSSFENKILPPSSVTMDLN